MRVRRILKWVGIVAGSLVGLIVLIVVLTSVLGGNGGSDGASEPTPTPNPTPISVSAVALQSEQELNEAAWERKYNENFALITGSISSITEAGSKYDVKLETDNFTVDVVCKVDKADESVVFSLQQGQTVSVLGRVTDDGIIDIVVKDCSIASSDGVSQPLGQGQATMSATPASAQAPTATTVAAALPPTAILEPTAITTPNPTPISVSAAALQSERELNEAAWERKYVDNLALITGSISSITEAGSKYDVKLRTDNFTVAVVCKVDKADESVVFSLQQGQTVSVLGRVTDDGIVAIVVNDCAVQ